MIMQCFHLVLQKRYTPLLVACEYKHKDMVEYLLTLDSVDLSASTVDGNTGLHIAAIVNFPEIVNLLIDRGCPTQATNKEVRMIEILNGSY